MEEIMKLLLSNIYFPELKSTTTTNEYGFTLLLFQQEPTKH
jgi:hypothetical protein